MHLTAKSTSSALLCLAFVIGTTSADDNNHGCPGPIIQPADSAEYCCVGGTLDGFSIDFDSVISTTSPTSHTAICATTIHLTDSEYSSKASVASAWVATATSGAMYSATAASASMSATPTAARGGAMRIAYDAGLQLVGLFGAAAVLL